MPSFARPLARPFALARPFTLALAVACAPACGTDPLPGSLEQANIVPGPNGYRWDAHWDRVLPDSVLADRAARPTGPPAMVWFNGRRHYFYGAAAGKLAHHVEGDSAPVLTDEQVEGAPAAVVANGNIEIFYRTQNVSNPSIDHVRWNGVYQLVRCPHDLGESSNLLRLSDPWQGTRG